MYRTSGCQLEPKPHSVGDVFTDFTSREEFAGNPEGVHSPRLSEPLFRCSEFVSGQNTHLMQVEQLDQFVVGWIYLHC